MMTILALVVLALLANFLAGTTRRWFLNRSATAGDHVVQIDRQRAKWLSFAVTCGFAVFVAIFPKAALIPVQFSMTAVLAIVVAGWFGATGRNWVGAIRRAYRGYVAYLKREEPAVKA